MREAVGAINPDTSEGQAVASQVRPPVVILYQHALLGEGIARYLLAQVGVVATVASALDHKAALSALALRPSVVIFETTERLMQLDLETLAPQAVMIDVSTVVTRGPAISPDAAGLEKILQAVQQRPGMGAT